MANGIAQETIENQHISLSEFVGRLNRLQVQYSKEALKLGSLDSATKKQLEKRRKDKQRLHSISKFFIEESWKSICPFLEVESCGICIGRPIEDLPKYLAELNVRNPAFAWGWLRARMDEALMGHIQTVLPSLAEQFPKEYEEYRKALRAMGGYYFRETPLHHLKAGYHTALAVVCKWYGEYKSLCPHAQTFPSSLEDTAKIFATFSMPMLHATDNILWDSAAANGFADARANEEDLEILSEYLEIATTNYRVDPLLSKEPRCGCPALSAKGYGNIEGAFIGILRWAEKTLSKYLTAEDSNRF